MYYVAGIQSYGTVIEIERNEGYAHLYLHAQGHANDRYEIGYMESRTGSENSVSSVLHDDLRISNSPEWQKMRKEEYGVDPLNIAVYENPIYTAVFPTFRFTVTDDFAKDDILPCSFTSVCASQEQLDEYNAAALNGDDLPTLECETIKSYTDNIRCLTSGSWIPYEITSKNPVIETSVIMCHCDRYVDTETARNF